MSTRARSRQFLKKIILVKKLIVFNIFNFQVCGRPVEVRKALTRHQIETATKRRENQARKGAFDREKRHTPEGGAGYPDRSAAPRYDPRERNPYDDRGG